MDPFKQSFIDLAVGDLGSKKELIVKPSPKDPSGKVIERVEVPAQPVVEGGKRDELLNNFAESMFKGKKVGAKRVLTEVKVPAGTYDGMDYMEHTKEWVGAGEVRVEKDLVGKLVRDESPTGPMIVKIGTDKWIDLNSLKENKVVDIKKEALDESEKVVDKLVRGLK